jgi:hypothetical protein
VKRVAVAVLLLALLGCGCTWVPRPAAESGGFCDAGWYEGTGQDGEVALNAVVSAFASHDMEWGRELRLYGSHGASVSVPCSREAEARAILHGMEDEGLIRYEPNLP